MGTLSWQVLRIGDTAASPQTLALEPEARGRAESGVMLISRRRSCSREQGQREEGVGRQEGSQGLWMWSLPPFPCILLVLLEQHGQEQVNSAGHCLLRIYKS